MQGDEQFPGSAVGDHRDLTRSTAQLLATLRSDVSPGAAVSAARTRPMGPIEPSEGLRQQERLVMEDWRSALCDADGARVGQLVQVAHGIRLALRRASAGPTDVPGAP